MARAEFCRGALFVFAEAVLKLLVGLGNPGAKYARNRHNVGFMAVDAIAGAHGFAPWRAKFSGEIAEGRLGTEKVLLLKPETYMNLSGDAAQAAAHFYKLEPADIIVFHDELDLAPGKVRVKAGGGTAGHNGLRSLGAHLGPDFTRVRIGIGHPGDRRLVTPHVLGDFAKVDADWLDPLLAGLADGAPALVSGDNSGFAKCIARQFAPPKSAPPKEVSEKAPPAAPDPGSEDRRSLLEKLADRFR
jgi:PTH1 family peptidyl-tRNA hydrolase